jgi:hypothetical protein
VGLLGEDVQLLGLLQLALVGQRLGLGLVDLLQNEKRRGRERRREEEREEEGKA